MAITPEAKNTFESLIMALGQLSLERMPEIIGIERKDASILYCPCEPVELTPESLRDAGTVVNEMVEILKKYREITKVGKALAANQIGISKAIIVFLNQDKSTQYFLNPKISWESEEQNLYWEMCISGTPLGVDVQRPASIKVTWYDLEGKNHEDLLEGLDARRMQHEIDHLYGEICYNTKGTKHETLGYGLNPSVYMNQKLRPV